jgi:hypothetical protein
MGKGRGNGNSVTVGQAIKLEINKLKKDKFIQFGRKIVYTANWTCGASIQVTTIYTNSEKVVRLKYNYSNKLVEYDIQLNEVKSNLGKGVILYFICPQTFKRCKVLYCCYGSEIFKSRGAYKNRIYYFTQSISKAFLTGARYNKVDTKINEMLPVCKTRYYKGKETIRYQRLKKLINKRAYLDEKKNHELEQYLLKYLGLSNW